MAGARYERVHYVGEKWGGGPHYAGEVFVLGDDEHGTWLWGPAGRTVTRGSETAFVTEQDLVAVLPIEGWWSATWWIGHPEVALYVNIQTPVVRTATTMSFVDLDLDVVRLIDGSSAIVDQDEFAQHQLALGYPSDVIAATEQAAAEVLRAVRADERPFDGVAARRWADTARAAGLTAD